MRSIAKFIFFKLMKWKFNGTFTKLKKCVIIVLPHTSWHDFYIGVFARKIIGIPMHFVAKETLFKPPFGWYFKWMGGRPIDRSKSNNYVASITSLFSELDEFRLTLTPEGTRKKVTQLKTGFYYIAKTAKVPIIMVAFDFAKKEIKFSKPFSVGEDIDSDFRHIYKFYKGVVGKIPAYSFQAK